MCDKSSVSVESEFRNKLHGVLESKGKTTRVDVTTEKILSKSANSDSSLSDDSVNLNITQTDISLEERNVNQNVTMITKTNCYFCNGRNSTKYICRICGEQIYESCSIAFSNDATIENVSWKICFNCKKSNDVAKNLL